VLPATEVSSGGTAFIGAYAVDAAKKEMWINPVKSGYTAGTVELKDNNLYLSSIKSDPKDEVLGSLGPAIMYLNEGPFKHDPTIMTMIDSGLLFQT